MPILPVDPRSVRPVLKEPPEAWQAEIRQAIRDPRELCRILQLPAELVHSLPADANAFPLLVPPSYLARMRPGDPSDPLLRQVLPLADERRQVAGYCQDPVGDLPASQSPGVLQKYQGRALLIVTGACAVHCRYCFRRHFPYQQTPRGLPAWHDALTAVAADPTIEEIILSGGDPLMLVDNRFEQLIARVEAIAHVQRLRIHTRLPVVVPRRVTRRFVQILQATRLTTVVVLHVNHAQELAPDVVPAVNRLRAASRLLFNQAVLLRGVNDSVLAQRQLSERLSELGVVPYYLHQLDRVAGAAHFEVPVATGRAIVAELRRQLPGYLVPRYVQELPGQPSKTVLL